MTENFRLPKLQNHNTRDHAWFGASNCERRLACPGSQYIEMQEFAKEWVSIITQEIIEKKPKKVFLEKRVVLDEHLQMFGTADLFFAFKEEKRKIVSVWDIKYGKGRAVEPSSFQLIYYGLAVQEEFIKN